MGTDLGTAIASHVERLIEAAVVTERMRCVQIVMQASREQQVNLDAVIARIEAGPPKHPA
jgi:hypothetical protein